MADTLTAYQIAEHLLHTGLAILFERARLNAVDKWQMGWTRGGEEPDSPPPEGYAPLGPWQPYGTFEDQDGWRRPLRKVGGSNV